MDLYCNYTNEVNSKFQVAEVSVFIETINIHEYILGLVLRFSYRKSIPLYEKMAYCIVDTMIKT